MNLAVMHCGKVLGEVVREIFKPRVPHHIKNSVIHLITGAKAHFHQVQPLALEHPVGNADGGGIVDVEGPWQLGVAKLFQRQLEDAPLFDV